MIALATRDDWTAAVLTWDDGAPQAWSPVDAIDAYSASVELYAWLVATFGEAPVVTMVGTLDGGWGLSVVTANAYTVTANAAAQALLRAPATQGPATTTATSTSLGIAGTVDAELVALRQWWRDASASGDATSNGSLLLPAPGASQRRPPLDVIVTGAGAMRWAAVASTLPIRRSGWVRDFGGSWRSLVVGIARRTAIVGTRQQLSIEVRG